VEIMESEKIPKTGRIGRFAKIIEKNLGEDLMLEILQDSDKYASLKAPEKASWWRSAVERLEDKAGIVKSIEIMNQCGQRCCGQGIRKTAKRLMDESKSMEEFLEKASTHEVKEGEIAYTLQDDNTIVGIFNRCFCGQVKQTKTPFKNNTYCHCSAEFHKQFFKAALEKPVEVELVQSIISGAKTCKFIIHIKKE
jgi:predicted hydrocarbon binding protein